MNKNRSGKALGIMFFCLLIIIVLPLSVFMGARKMINYKLNGAPVHCEVIKVEEDLNGRQQVRVKYTNKNGIELSARATMNRRVSVGDEAEGFVLPEQPFDVYVMPAPALIGVVCGIFGVLVAAAAIGFVVALKMYLDHKKLVSHGTLTKGRLLFIQETKRFVYNTQVSFRDSDGEEQIFNYVFTRVVPEPEKDYNVAYIKKKNGKVAAELIEL